ncbi:MAG: VCBS repeat-containing protein, partial [bacterium]
MKRGCFSILLATSLIIVTGYCQDQPWSETPNWISNETDFTTSVALVDLDNDGDLDFVAGNYKYPYSFDSDHPEELQVDQIGGGVVAYRNTGGVISSMPTTFLSGRCVDNIAFADYDKDGDLDMAVGFVVGKGNDGGVMVFNNNRINPPPGQPWT